MNLFAREFTRAAFTWKIYTGCNGPGVTSGVLDRRIRRLCRISASFCAARSRVGRLYLRRRDAVPLRYRRGKRRNSLTAPVAGRFQPRDPGIYICVYIRIHIYSYIPPVAGRALEYLIAGCDYLCTVLCCQYPLIRAPG